MIETNFIEAVTERDIDLLVLEEMHVSSDFRTWLVKSVYGDGHEPIIFHNAWHSLSHPELGESDLVFIFDNPAGERSAILFENKIDASPQPEQGARYKARGEVGIEVGDWQTFKTCILAPRLYLSREKDAHVYEVQISYEAIQEWFERHTAEGERARYKSRMLHEAIEQSRRGYNPKVNERVTKFWHSYWVCASREFPELSMREPGHKPANATWIELHPKELERRRKIVHKLNVGFVDLQVNQPRQSVDEIKSAYGSLISPDMDIVQTGKSISVRVPMVDLFDEFVEQIDDVRAAYRLLYLSRAISEA